MADEVKQLLLQVDATVELLRRNLNDGAKAVEQFEGKAKGSVDRANASFDRLGQGLATGFSSVVAKVNAEISSIDDRVRKTEQQVRSSFGGIKAALLNSTSALAAGFTVDHVKDLTDGYTRFTNQLKVAGVEANRLSGLQQQLFEIAQRNGAPLEAIGTLYSRAAQSGKQLGASQDDLLKLSGAVGAALKIQGTSAAEAQGALLQLSQALSSGTVHAEEFNSVNEGLTPLLIAAAEASNKYKGNVAALKNDILAQKVTSQEFFQLILGGYDRLQAKASKATLTIGSSFVVLNNALGKYIGEQDQALSATEAISGGIVKLANNLDLIAGAVAVLGVGFAARAAIGSTAAAEFAAGTGGAAAATRVFVEQLMNENVVMLGTAAAAEAKARAVEAGAAAEVAAIEVTLAARRADAEQLAANLVLIERQRADALQAQAAMATNATLGFGTAVGYGRNDAARANQDLKAQIVTKRALAVANEEVAATETALAAAQARQAIATEAATAATAANTVAARAGAAASKLLSGALTLIGGSVVGGAVVLTLAAIAAGILYMRSQSEDAAESVAALQRNHRELNEVLAETAKYGAAAQTAIAGTGSSAATAAGQMRSFAGATGEAAEKLIELAKAQRSAAVLKLEEKRITADQRGAEAAARLRSGQSDDSVARFGYLPGQQESKKRDLKAVLTARSDSDAAQREIDRLVKQPLGTFLPESARTGGVDVPGQIAQTQRDLTIARARGNTGANRGEINRLDAKLYELTQYQSYRKRGFSDESAKSQAASDAAQKKAAGEQRISAQDSAKAGRTAVSEQKKQVAAAHDAAADARAFSTQERSANDEIARARAELSGSAEERAQIERDRIESERQSRSNELDDQKAQGRFGEGKIADTRVKTLKALNDQRASLETEVVDKREQQRVTSDQLAITLAGLGDQRDLAQLQSNLAETTTQRRNAELRILDLQYQEEETRLRAITVANGATDAEQKIAEARLAKLPELKATEKTAIERRDAGPMDAYLQKLRSADINEQLEDVKVHGLQSLEEGLTGIVTGTQSVKDAFRDMATSIIADLARIAIEKAIVSVIGLGFSTGGPVLKRAGGGPIFGPGSSTSDSIPAMLSDGEFVINARSTARYRPIVEAINDGTFGRFSTGGLVGMPTVASRVSAREMRGVAAGRMGGGPRQLNFDLRGAVTTAELVKQMQQMAIQSGGAAYQGAVDHTNEMFRMAGRPTL